MTFDSIQVKYSCRCGIHRAEVYVPVRPSAMDVVTWVQNVVGAWIVTDHKQRSPDCTSQEMSEVMIPIDKDREYIGAPRTQ